MQLFFSEFTPDYTQYAFPYQVLLKQDGDDDLARIYLSGFLPFRSKQRWFYLARSTRIKLSKLELSSENRRILRKMEQVTFTVQPIEQFAYTADVQKLCAKFADSLAMPRKAEVGSGDIEQGEQNEMAKTNAKAPISTAAIRAMFTGKANVNAVMTFRHTETHEIAGYVGLVWHENFIHYAHPFMNVDWEDKNLNIGMMTMALDWAQQQRKQFAFLGTCYSESALYKTQFSEFEYFTGRQWSNDLEQLKMLVKNKGNYAELNLGYEELWTQPDLVGMRLKFK